MKISKELERFLITNLYKKRGEYYLNFFKTMSESCFEKKIEEYCYIAHQSEKKHLLGSSDTDILMLIITMKIIENSILRKKRNLSNQEEISIYASKEEIMEKRRTYRDAESQIVKASKDYWEVRKRLCENIKKVFSRELSLLLESTDLFKEPANFGYQRPGYDFTYHGREIYVINWQPMGGD